MFSRLLRNASRRPFLCGSASACLTAVYRRYFNEKDLPENAMLLIEFDKLNITDRKLTAKQQLDDNTVELHELVETLEAAKADDKIVCMFASTGDGLNVDSYGTADIEEIRRAVKSFGKQKLLLSFKNAFRV